MLTPAASWLTAANAGAAPCLLLSITDGSTTWKCTSSATTAFASDVAIVNVSSVGSEVDPMTREMQSAECTVDVLDAWIRPIMVNNRLKGQTATVTYGFQGIAEADFIAYASGPLEEIAPNGPKDSGIVTLSIMDLFTVMQKVELLASWINKHPLQILYDGATGDSILSRCGFNASTWVDESTFDPTDAAYTSSISHWNMSRIQAFDVYEKTSAFEMMSQLCRLMNGQIISDETGLLQFKRFDSTAATVDDWTVDDIVEGSFEQEPLDANVINQVKIKFGGGGGDYPDLTFVMNETGSQTAYAYPGQTSRVITHEFETPWCPGYSVAPSADIAAGAVSTVAQAQLHGFSGMRGAYPGPQAASATVSAARPVYIWIDNHINAGSESEIVVAEACTVDTNNCAYAHWYDFVDGAFVDTAFRNQATFSSITRAQLGTSDVAHTKSSQTCLTWLWDVTPLVDYGSRLLERFAYGCPIVSLATPAHKMAVQQGDLITLTIPDFCAYGIDGSTTSYKWEVIGKEPDLMASPPVIRWKLAYAGINVLVKSGEFYGRFGKIGTDITGQAFSEASQGFVPTGYTFAAGAGLEGSTAAGAVVSGEMRTSRTAALSHTFTASKDTYLAVDPSTGDVSYYAVANGAAQPSKRAHEVWLTKVVTDGAGITSSTDLRETLPIPGSLLKVGTGPLTHLAQSTGVLDNVTSITARSLDNITDGATYAKVLAAGLTSGVVNSTGIVAGAVTTAKIGAAAVGVYQSMSASIVNSINTNPCFIQRSRG